MGYWPRRRTSGKGGDGLRWYLAGHGSNLLPPAPLGWSYRLRISNNQLSCWDVERSNHRACFVLNATVFDTTASAYRCECEVQDFDLAPETNAVITQTERSGTNHRRAIPRLAVAPH